MSPDHVSDTSDSTDGRHTVEGDDTSAHEVAIIGPSDGEGRRLALAARRLLPGPIRWTVVGVVPPDPALETGATGFAGPVLSLEEMESRAAADRERGLAYVDAVVGALDHEPITNTAVISAERALPLLEELRAASVDLVVLSAPSTGWSDGRSTVSEAVLDESPCPALVVPSEVDPERSLRTVLVAVDGSPLDDEMIARVNAFVGRDGDSRLVLAHVDDATPIIRSVSLSGNLGLGGAGLMSPTTVEALDPDARDAASLAEEVAGRTGVPDVEIAGAAGDIVEELFRLVDAHDVDVLCVGTHDRSWWSRLFEPSVSQAVIERAETTAILLVRSA